MILQASRFCALGVTEICETSLQHDSYCTLQNAFNMFDEKISVFRASREFEFCLDVNAETYPGKGVSIFISTFVEEVFNGLLTFAGKHIFYCARFYCVFSVVRYYSSPKASSTLDVITI